MKLQIVYWVALLAFFVGPAYGQGWSDDYDGTGTECQSIQPNPETQRRCWYNFTGAGTGNSPMLKINQCENFSVAFTPDWDGIETTATVIFYSCLDPTNTDACYALEGLTLSSTLPVVYGADGDWGYIDVITAPGATANARVVFRCNQ
jgi:hypothetical protein